MRDNLVLVLLDFADIQPRLVRSFSRLTDRRKDKRTSFSHESPRSSDGRMTFTIGNSKTEKKRILTKVPQRKYLCAIYFMKDAKFSTHEYFSFFIYYEASLHSHAEPTFAHQSAWIQPKLGPTIDEKLNISTL